MGTFAVSTSAEISVVCLCVSLYNPTISLTDQCSNNTLGKTIKNNYEFTYVCLFKKNVDYILYWKVDILFT